MKYILRGVKISVKFVDGQSSSKVVGMVEEGNFPLLIIKLLLKIKKKKKKFQFEELLSIYAKKLLYLKFLIPIIT